MLSAEWLRYFLYRLYSCANWLGYGFKWNVVLRYPLLDICKQQYRVAPIDDGMNFIIIIKENVLLFFFFLFVCLVSRIRFPFRQMSCPLSSTACSGNEQRPSYSPRQ